MTAESVVLINAFEVPEGEDDAFLQGWERTRDFLSTQDGYLSTRLHRSLSPNADFRFVNVAVWQSEQSFVQPAPGRSSGKRPFSPFSRLPLRGRARGRAVTAGQQRQVLRAVLS